MLDSNFARIKERFQSLLIQCQNDNNKLIDHIFCEIEDILYFITDDHGHQMTLPGFDLFFILDHFYLANIERVKQIFLAQYDE